MTKRFQNKVIAALAGKRMFKHEMRKALNCRREHLDNALEALQSESVVKRNASGTWRLTRQLEANTVPVGGFRIPAPPYETPDVGWFG